MPDATTSEKLLVLDDENYPVLKPVPVSKDKFIPAVFTENKPDSLTSLEALAVSELETMGCSFYWPTDTKRIPKVFDLSFATEEEDLKTARLLLSMVTDYVRAPAIVDPFRTYYARKAYKENLPPNLLTVVNWNCLRHNFMWAASGGWEMLASLLLNENDPRKRVLEKMAKKVNGIVKPKIKDESFGKVKVVRDTAFKALRMFAKK